MLKALVPDAEKTKTFHLSTEAPCKLPVELIRSKKLC
jgi:hypothetical protein